MAIRNVLYTVSDDSTITPTTTQYGGVQGEHNATQVSFNIPQTSPLANPNYRYYIECVDSAGGYDRTPELRRLVNRVYTLVPLAWTQYGGISTVRLIVEADGEIICSLEGRLQFEDRGEAIAQVDGLLRTDITQAVETCHESADTCRAAADSCREDAATCEEIAKLDSPIAAAAANAAAAAANAAADNANDAADDAARVREEVAEGGFIESLKELNRGDKFRVWVGSQEEYNTLTDTPINTLCIVDDEELTDYVVAQGSAIVGEVTWRYQKWHSGICRLWAHLVVKPDSQYATNNPDSPYGPEENGDGSYTSERFMIYLPFAVNNHVVIGTASHACSVVNTTSGSRSNYTHLRLIKHERSFNNEDYSNGIPVNLTIDGTWK